jgi:hypothetical protein
MNFLEFGFGSVSGVSPSVAGAACWKHHWRHTKHVNWLLTSFSIYACAAFWSGPWSVHMMKLRM